MGRGYFERRQFGAIEEVTIMANLPKHKKYVVIGAGLDGLSTAWHLA
jgi:hypothetical protein